MTTKALSGKGMGLIVGAAALAFALWYSYAIGHMRGERDGIRWAEALHEPPNVEAVAFGAKCDGTTDDTLALCNAREAAEAQGPDVFVKQPGWGRCLRPHGIGKAACAAARAAAAPR